MRKAIELAKSGDAVALRLCVDRLVPRRDRTVQLDLPKLLQACDVAEAMSVVIEAAAAGRITLEDARDFLSLLESHRRGIETADLAFRLELLEQADRERARKKR